MSTAPLVFGNGFEGLALVPVIEVEGVGRGSFRGLPAEARGPPGSDGALAFADKDGRGSLAPGSFLRKYGPGPRNFCTCCCFIRLIDVLDDNGDP